MSINWKQESYREEKFWKSLYLPANISGIETHFFLPVILTLNFTSSLELLTLYRPTSLLSAWRQNVTGLFRHTLTLHNKFCLLHCMNVKFSFLHWGRNIGWGWSTNRVPKTDKVTGESRRLYNEVLCDVYLTLTIICVIKSRTMRWIGHVARMIGTRS